MRDGYNNTECEIAITECETAITVLSVKPQTRLTIKDHLESFDGVLEWHQFTLGAGEDLSDLERLTEESLDLTRTSNCQLVVFRQLIHTKDGDDIL